MGNDTELEYLDLSDNEITYLYPESFQFHPRLNLTEPDSNLTQKMFVRDIKVKTSQIMCSYDCKVKMYLVQ